MTEIHDEEHSSFLSRLFTKRGEPSNQNELEQVIHEASENDVIDEDTEDMIQGIFDINRLRVSDVMIPSSDIVTINATDSLAETAKKVVEFGHSRYPVIGEDKDHVVGILLAKDLIPYTAGFKMLKDDGILSLLRKPVIVPESKHVNSMLKEFQQNRYHIAIVVDEFGGVSGLVTIEDILEVIVGDIDDEYDTEVNEKNIILNKDNGSYLVNGLTTLEEFDEYFKTDMSSLADVDTVAGLTTHTLGKFPEVGESVEIENFIFRVIEASERRVVMLEVKKNS
ncbi:MAG: transporter associated domain-containing protein [Succinivibrio sp.]|uniref:Magnesium and cobalt efflux protein CorC n=1 Tax=Succinivibrio faecicola TaxID=2820300 RepID=A0ABS7DG89_9GAMM|nr:MULTISPECIES: transporter associated domain-containing protein [Succinivibrio]MBW7569551.1 CBS domain-containing protein [Succinivibrio faecicola]MCI6938943.1 CBS domain-containing protein [Succinatimonas hippei]MDD6206356.1 transporter associated domain-containing protein [Succinivibrio sp.]